MRALLLAACLLGIGLVITPSAAADHNPTCLEFDDGYYHCVVSEYEGGLCILYDEGQVAEPDACVVPIPPL